MPFNNNTNNPAKRTKRESSTKNVEKQDYYFLFPYPEPTKPVWQLENLVDLLLN